MDLAAGSIGVSIVGVSIYLIGVATGNMKLKLIGTFLNLAGVISLAIAARGIGRK